MYDIHNHIVPGVDDGARDVEESFGMGSMASNDGVKAIIATPHYRSGECEVDPAKIMTMVFMLNQELRSEGCPINILPGMEVHISADLLQLYEEKKIITLNYKDYMLLELPMYDSLPFYLDDVLFRLQLKGVRPIIAHPERCRCVIKDPISVVYRLIEKGCLIQTNCGSLLGKFGRKVRSAANVLFKYNMVHIVASDNHSTIGRYSPMGKGYKYVAKKFGSDLADAVFVENPGKVIKGEDIFLIKPAGIMVRRFY